MTVLLTPIDAPVLVNCSLYYHFLQQENDRSDDDSEQATLDRLVRERIQWLHAAGGPARISIAESLGTISGADYPEARQMIKSYYRRLKQDWPQVIAVNETMRLKISITSIPVTFQGTVDRIDKATDGGVVAVMFRTGAEKLPTPDSLAEELSTTIYHALVAASYSHRRPVYIQELWLQADRQIEVELSEEIYRHNLGSLRKPVRSLIRGKVVARPGLHCETCPFKHRGCPVYAHEADNQNETDDFLLSPSDGKIPARKWIFKI